MFKVAILFSLLSGICFVAEPVSLPPTAVAPVFLEFNNVNSIDNSPLANRIENDINEVSGSIVSSYSAEKAASEQLRARLNSAFNLKKITMEEVKISFSDHLVNRLIPHWYGTEWSFNGHTAIPKKGKIACGYFVSTTLRDMGLRLNRYKLAQKSPIDEAKMISCGAVVNTITASNTSTAIQEIGKITQEGISFIGFDEGHVGFLLKKEGELFLVHSNYLYPNAEVCMERLEESNVFKKFLTFHLVDISNNDLLIQRWLKEGDIY